MVGEPAGSSARKTRPGGTGRPDRCSRSRFAALACRPAGVVSPLPRTCATPRLYQAGRQHAVAIHRLLTPRRVASCVIRAAPVRVAEHRTFEKKRVCEHANIKLYSQCFSGGCRTHPVVRPEHRRRDEVRIETRLESSRIRETVAAWADLSATDLRLPTGVPVMSLRVRESAEDAVPAEGGVTTRSPWRGCSTGGAGRGIREPTSMFGLPSSPLAHTFPTRSRYVVAGGSSRLPTSVLGAG